MDVEIRDNDRHKCHRCGRCCIDVGRTFWKNGDFGDNEHLNRLANNGDYEHDDLPCAMLEITNGLAVCLIEKRYGRNAKPVSCREYPFDGEPCFYQEAMAVESGADAGN